MLPIPEPSQARSAFARVSSAFYPAFPLALALAFALAFSGCQTETTPDAETVLWLKLNDSLSRYDNVLIQIVDRNDTEKLLATLWNKPLPAPRTDIQPFRLKNLGNEDFIVKIQGYLSGRLALHTQISYIGGQKTVQHMEVPPIIAKDRLTQLTPSEGALSPVFNMDTPGYALIIDQDESFHFTLASENPSAVITFEGDTVASGASTEKIAVSDKTDALTITVTDPLASPPSKRTYTVILSPLPPPLPSLGSLVPTAGSLSPDFDPAVNSYLLTLPPGVDTVAFTASPSDPRKMTMNVADKALLPGQRSQTFKIEPNSPKRITFEVFRGQESSLYVVSASLSTAPPP